ncbi:hypothetical protein Lal_00018857 [Lupinus albus]|nr:hypothetical protein Lal_00018857 [Lupinus albus]
MTLSERSRALLITAFVRATYHRWLQYLITTNIPEHATTIIRSMLDRLRIDQLYLQRNMKYISLDRAYSAGSKNS